MFITEFLHKENKLHYDIYQLLLNIYRDQTADVSTVMHFSIKKLKTENVDCFCRFMACRLLFVVMTI